MADALTFILAMTDRLSGPASVATANVKRLNDQLVALSKTAAELPNIKLPKLTGGGAGRAPKAGAGIVKIPFAGDPNATGAAQAFVVNEKQRAKAAGQAAKAIAAAKKQEERATNQAAKAAQKAADQQRKAFQKQVAFANKGQQEIQKAQKQAQRNMERAAAKAARDAKKRSKESIAAADKAHATVNDLASSFGPLGKAIGFLTNPATLAGAAVVALGAAFTYAAIQGGSLALAATEAKGDTMDMLEAMLGSAAAATETYDKVRDLTRDFAISLGDAQGLASSLTAAGITNKDMLHDALTSVAQVDSVIKGAGGKVEAILQKAAQTGKFAVSTKQLVGTGVQLSALYEELAKRTGKGVKQIEKELKAGKIEAGVGIAALTKVIDTKFGALAGKQALDFSAQMVRLKDNLFSLFDGVKTGPFLVAFSKIVALFDEANPAGQAMKAAITGIFDKLFAVATAVLPYIKVLLQGLVIIGLKVFIAFKPLTKALSDAFGKKTMGSAEKTADILSKFGDIAAFAVSAFVKLLMMPGVFTTIANAVKLVVGTVKILAFVVFALYSGWVLVMGVLATVLGWFTRLGSAAVKLGVDITSGLIKGLLSMAGPLIGAMASLASQALKAFKSVFGIASPSKVMAKMGVNMTEGLTKGLAKSSPMANVAMGNVVNMDAFRSARSSAAPAPSSSSSSSSSVTIAAGAIVISGVANPEAMRDAFPDILAEALERAGLSAGEGEGVAA